MDLRWLAYAEEKLAEIVTLRNLAIGRPCLADLTANQAAAQSRRQSPRIHRPAVQQRAGQVAPDQFQRHGPVGWSIPAATAVSQRACVSGCCVP